LKYQRVNAHREAAQFNGIVSGRPASAWGKASALLGPPDTTFFIFLTPYPDFVAFVAFCQSPNPRTEGNEGNEEDVADTRTPKVVNCQNDSADLLRTTRQRGFFGPDRTHAGASG
jgi:hypothetical protein